MVLYAIILYMIVINIIWKLRINCSFRSLVNQPVQSEITLKIIAWQELAVTAKYFAPVGKECTGCLTYPCKPRQSVFARAGYHAWRQQPYLRGPVAEADPEPLIDMTTTPSLLQVPVCR